MKTSLMTRILAALCACLITSAVVIQIAEYAYPEQPALQLASAIR
jgi:hypothetical protein